MSRQTIGSGVAQNTPENLRGWVRNPQALKTGCLMPSMQLTDGEADQIAAFLLMLE
jgi:cytochrome c oxidase subunit 2